MIYQKVIKVIQYFHFTVDRYLVEKHIQDLASKSAQSVAVQSVDPPSTPNIPPEAIAQRNVDATLQLMRQSIPVEMNIPSLLRKSIAASEYLPRSSFRGIPLPMSNLGDFQCFSLTKVGRHENTTYVTHSDDKERAWAPLQGSFLVQYNPLISLLGGYEEEALAFRLIAEPYEFVVPMSKLEDRTEGIVPSRVILHRTELQNIVSALSELASVASLHGSMNEPLEKLSVFLNSRHVQMMEPLVAMLKATTSITPTIYVRHIHIRALYILLSVVIFSRNSECH